VIVQVFNSSVVSGPEALVIPALPSLGEKAAVVFLSESRKGNFSKEPPAYAASFGLEVHEIRVRSRWDRQAIRELSELLSRLGPRIVHAHEVKAAAYVAAAAPPERSYRLFTTNHGIRAKRAPKLRFYEWLFTHWVMPRFDRVFCVCSSDRELLIRRGVPESKVEVHLNGIDRKKITLSERQAESKRIRALWNAGVKDGALCFGLVGRLAPEKRHDYTLRAFQRAVVLAPELDLHLVIFGRGALEEALKRRTAELGLDNRVHWMGYRGTVGDELAGLDLLLSLSIAEGLPVNVIEAGWAATPVLATGIDGNLDLMPDKNCGVLVKVNEREETIAREMVRLARDSQLRSRLGSGLQRRVESSFSGKIWLANLLEFYR
jgi:glycosyltransferase involved in cell wall biosynthesis